MGAPQIVWIVLACIGLGIHLARHGQPKNENFNWLVRAVAIGFEALLLWWGGFFGSAECHAAEAIPRAAYSYRADLTRQARLVWGLDAPVATFAAQIHTESRWNPAATSPVGARGLAQFMPQTELWINGAHGWRDGDATNPVWALRALVTYDRWLWDRITASDDCQRMAMTLSSYNGGLGWLQRDQRLASVAPGKGPGFAMRWFDGVERFNSGRSAAAWKENRAYPRLILKAREPLYAAAGWGMGVCA